MRNFYKGGRGGLTIGETVCLFTGRSEPLDATVASIGREYFTVQVTSQYNSVYRFRRGCSEGSVDHAANGSRTVKIYASRSSCLDLIRREAAWLLVKNEVIVFSRTSEPPTQEELRRLECGINEALSKELG